MGRVGPETMRVACDDVDGIIVEFAAYTDEQARQLSVLGSFCLQGTHRPRVHPPL